MNRASPASGHSQRGVFPEPDETMSSVDHASQYRRLFGRFATGVAVVVAEDGDEIFGMTVNSLTSVSLDPPLLLFCARNESRSAERLLITGRFSVNILRHDQHLVSRHFAGRPEPVPPRCLRRDGFAWIEEANAAFLCAVEAVHPAGDHRIILGRVAAMSGPEAAHAPLLYFNGGYAALEAAPLPAATGA